MGIPMVQREVEWETYEQGFKSTVCELKRNGVEGAVFGDISNIAGHEGWIDRVCSELGIKPVKPLWGSDPWQLLTEFLKEGFKALVVMVKADLLGERWLGRKIDEAFIRDLRKVRKKIDIHPCGELGEYHTFVYDGPVFKRRIKILESKKILKNGYRLLDILQYKLIRKGYTWSERNEQVEKKISCVNRGEPS
jgi:uncharacterized protein (TIGR00290 family)